MYPAVFFGLVFSSLSLILPGFFILFLVAFTNFSRNRFDVGFFLNISFRPPSVDLKIYLI